MEGRETWEYVFKENWVWKGHTWIRCIEAGSESERESKATSGVLE